MSYWRMQLHPAESGQAVRHTIESLAAGYIGLDFSRDLGDLSQLERDDLPEKQRDYWDFAHSMKTGDRVLIMAHHFPFALATISGPYNYIRSRAPELGVWFRHFRPVKSVMYYADYTTNARSWKRIAMIDTISPLHRTDTESYQLIEKWLQSVG
jgi:hypothetical protein